MWQLSHWKRASRKRTLLFLHIVKIWTFPSLRSFSQYTVSTQWSFIDEIHRAKLPGTFSLPPLLACPKIAPGPSQLELSAVNTYHTCLIHCLGGFLAAPKAWGVPGAGIQPKPLQWPHQILNLVHHKGTAYFTVLNPFKMCDLPALHTEIFVSWLQPSWWSFQKLLKVGH